MDKYHVTVFNQIRFKICIWVYNISLLLFNINMTIHKIKCHYSWKDGQCGNLMCNINMRSLTTSMISMRDNDCFISTIRRAENVLKDVLWNIVPLVHMWSAQFHQSLRSVRTMTNTSSDSILVLLNFWYIWNKNVDIKFSAHNVFLEQPSSSTLKVERLENQIILYVLGASKPKGLNSIANNADQGRLRIFVYDVDPTNLCKKQVNYCG
jgi:hypothetical protein